MLRIFCFIFLLSACSASSTQSQKVYSPSQAYFSLAEVPGALNKSVKLKLSKLRSADWSITRAGLINLDHPKAAELNADAEAIELYAYLIEHPNGTRVLIDNGLGTRFEKLSGANVFPSPVKSLLTFGDLELKESLSSWLKGRTIHAAFVTHLHFDHLLGLGDLPARSPVIFGPGELSEKRVNNAWMRPLYDYLLASHKELREVQFPDTTRRALDWFGDQSLFVIWSPGHTGGSLAFLAQTTEGPQLLLGDSSHSWWGWANGVSPGHFSEDIKENQASLDALRGLAQALPGVHVHPGHQSQPTF